MVQLNVFLTDEENTKLDKVQKELDIPNKNDTVRKMIRDFKLKGVK